jgi:hypothetical protein
MEKMKIQRKSDNETNERRRGEEKTKTRKGKQTGKFSPQLEYTKQTVKFPNRMPSLDPNIISNDEFKSIVQQRGKFTFVKILER